MNRPWTWLLMAWLVATAATSGALFLGEVMGMTPCVLCWYQRIFMFPLAIILGIACFTDDRRGAVYGLALALGGYSLPYLALACCALPVAILMWRQPAPAH
jgi:disulfide bond formation protein DsbB